MRIYLTSHIGGSYQENGSRLPMPLNPENGLADSLRKHWKDNANVLLISADPEDTEKNNGTRNLFAAAFPMSGLSIGKMDMCDARSLKLLDNISAYDVLILAGGHVPTQNRFFKRIRLKERLPDFDGILIGISAGTMNSAEIVYAQPELEGESVDARYERFLSGLGLTKLMMIPHYQAIKEDILDGRRLFEDITYADSYGREFYALEDGSYCLFENGTTTLFGAAYRIKDAPLKQICEKNQSILIAT